MMRKVSQAIVLMLFLLTSLSSPVYPQGFFDLGLEEENEISLVVGEIDIISVSSPTRVSVRNPSVIEVNKVSDKEIVISAKKRGETILTIWDARGEKEFYVSVLSHDLDKVKERLDKVINEKLKISGVKLKENEATGKLMLIGEVTAAEKEQLDQVLDPFYEMVEGKRLSATIDNLLTVKKEDKMVEIEARILELNKSDLDKLGIKWMEYIQIRQEPYKTEMSSGTGAGIVETTLNKIKPWTGVWGMSEWSRDALHARLDILIRDGKGRELSRPKLLCLSGEEASLLVGGEVPYVSAATTTSVGLGITVEYKEYGVILKLRPTVLKDGRIFVTLTTEVSDLDFVNSLTQIQGYTVPAFTKREASTVLNLTSGDTIFIAGLIKNKDSENIDKLPALGSIPIIGALFRSREFQNEETELVISLTPKVVQMEGQKDKQLAIEKNFDETFKRDLRAADTSPDDLQGYILMVQDKILDNIAYPASLLHTGWEGVVVLKLYIDQTGELNDIQMVKSSGYRAFDDEAFRVVKGMSFPAFPSDVQLEELKVEIPIVYRERKR